MKAHRPYQLEEYDPSWKTRFSIASEKIRPILGENLVEIEHVGSTSVEGLVAKPQIDVLVVVKDLTHVPDVYQTFKEAGFIPHGRGYVTDDDEYVSEDAPDGKRLTSIHILQEGNPKIEEYKVFRDYLSKNQDDRALYAETKRKLYSSHASSYAEYDSGKSEVIAAIKARAKQWASRA